MKNKKVITFIVLILVLITVGFVILLWKTDSFFITRINVNTFARDRVSILTLNEGEKFIPIGIGARLLACKPGLNTVPDLSYSSQGMIGMGCGFATWGSDKSFVCTKCGNGSCGIGEDICNCPKDCKSKN